MKSDLFYLILGRIIAAIIMIAGLRIMTTLLDPESFGIYSLLIAFQGLCGLLLVNPIGQHINRHTHAWWDDGTLFARLISYNRYLILVSILMGFIVAIWWLLYPGTDRSTSGAFFSALAISAIVYFGTWNGTYIYALNMLGFRAASVGWMLISSVAALTFSSLFAYFYQNSISWVLGQSIGMAIGALGARLLLYRNKKGATVKKGDGCNGKSPSLLDRKSFLLYCLPLAAATGLMWLQNTGYRFWVGSNWGATDLGLLAIGLSISSQIWGLIETLSMQFLNPYFFRHIENDKSDTLKSLLLSDMINVMWPIYAVLAGFNLLLAQSLLFVLTNERYHSITTFIVFGVFIEFARCTANLWSYAAQIEKRTTPYIGPYSVGCFTMCLGAIAVYYFHSEISAMAAILSFSSVAMCITMIYVMESMILVKLDINRWLAGILVLSTCILFVSVVQIRSDNFTLNLLVLMAGLFAAGIAIFALLWRNPALGRLTSISLRNNTH